MLQARVEQLENEQKPVASGPFSELILWKSTMPASSSNLGHNIAEAIPSLHLPIAPTDAYTSYLESDTWTRTGWTKAHVRHLLDAMFTWEYLPVSCLYRDEFLQSYDTGSTQYCSSALVYAMLAVSSRIINERRDESRLLPSGWFGSKLLFDEAEALLKNVGRSFNIADIQALGVLSLYCIRCGQEKESQNYANAFLTSITNLREHTAGTADDEVYSRMEASTYCGAVSLCRYVSSSEYGLQGIMVTRISMVHLATGALFTVPIQTLGNHLSILSELSILTQGVEQARHTSVGSKFQKLRAVRSNNIM